MIKNELIKCVIPAAGQGTRLRAAAGDGPKELVAVGGRPMIDWAIEEAVASGLTDICLIGSPGKRMMRSHVEQLISCRSGPRPNLLWIEQERPTGLARAIARAREFVGDEPFGLLLPDNLVQARLPVFSQMMPWFEVYGTHLIALMEVRTAEAAAAFSHTGRVDLERLKEPVFRVTRIYAKERNRTFPWIEERRQYRLYPRSIHLPDLFDELDKLAPPPEEEYDDVPIFQRLAAEGRLLACLTEVDVFDAGNLIGLRHARWAFR